MDMKDVLKRAMDAVSGREEAPKDAVFDVRRAFGERQGKQIVFPVGLGSALAKAVREGYLRVVGEDSGSRRRGRKYAFTRKGLDLVG